MCESFGMISPGVMSDLSPRDTGIAPLASTLAVNGNCMQKCERTTPQQSVRTSRKVGEGRGRRNEMASWDLKDLTCPSVQR